MVLCPQLADAVFDAGTLMASLEGVLDGEIPALELGLIGSFAEVMICQCSGSKIIESSQMRILAELQG